MKPNELRLWRLGRRLTQKKLAHLLGCGERTVQDWEGGTAAPPAYLQLALDGVDLHQVMPAAVRGIRRGSLEAPWGDKVVVPD